LFDFTTDVFASLTRAGWRERGECYLRGLMLDGKRKSIQPMASRLPEVHEQALNHFVTVSPWDPVAVRQRLAQKMSAAIDPVAWVLDDTGYLKSGDASPCVARQYTGTAGKVTNCQIGVSVHLASDEASCPANWRLFVPERWDPASSKAPGDVAARRRRAGIPDHARHREKWRLGLDMIDEMIRCSFPEVWRSGRCLSRMRRRHRVSRVRARPLRPSQHVPPGLPNLYKLRNGFPHGSTTSRDPARSRPCQYPPVPVPLPTHPNYVAANRLSRGRPTPCSDIGKELLFQRKKQLTPSAQVLARHKP
jgi:hypothetical protein